jgi:hypothetical protein
MEEYEFSNGLNISNNALKNSSNFSQKENIIKDCKIIINDFSFEHIRIKEII